MFNYNRIKILEEHIKIFERQTKEYLERLDSTTAKHKLEKEELIHLLKMKEEKMNVENEKKQYTYFRDDCVRQLAVKDKEIQFYRETYKELNSHMQYLTTQLMTLLPKKKGK